VTQDGRSILVVEDDEGLRSAIAAFLEGEGYSVIEAEDGEAALRVLDSTERFCLILLDLFMPVLNGWDFRARQLSDARLAGIPVIVITADAHAPQKALQLGAVDFMTKPLVLDRLRELVGQHC